MTVMLRQQNVRIFWLVLVAIALVACGRDEERAKPKAQEIKRLILISIDTLRADALGSYGNPAGTSANLDHFAEEGVRFETCIAPSPLTLPSHGTILTGLHPLEHGLLVNSERSLASDIGTLAETLQDAGWNTGAVVSSAILHHRHGLDRGFSNYSDDLFSDVLDPNDAQAIPSADARATTLAAINWLSSQPAGDRLFLFLHYIDPHTPYSAPKQFVKAFKDDPYLAEVAHTDAWIGKLAVYLQDSGLLEGTAFVITSDHGEHRGQHGMPTHGYFLYDEVLRVPLILAGAGIPAGVVARNPVGLIDIVPTVLSLLGLTIPPELPGRDILADLSPSKDERALVSVSYEPALSYGWSPLWSLWTPEEKFILAPRPEYFVTTSDPGELENVAADHPERVRELEKLLRERADRYLTSYHGPVPIGLDMATQQQLMALGYGTASTNEEFDLDDFSKRDPKDMVKVILRMSDYHTAIGDGDYPGASAILDEIEAADPNIPMVKEQRSYLFLLSGREAELLEWLDGMPADFRASPTQRYRRAVALGRLGRREEAMVLLRETLDQVPEDTLSRFELANQLNMNDQPKEAMEQYRILLDEDPRNRAGRLNYAQLLKRSGDRHGAIAELRILVEMQPTYAKGLRNLGLDLAGVGNHPEAIAMLQRSIQLAPNAANRARTEEIIAELKAIR